MKFLCVLCDQPMKLVDLPPPDRGALSIVYECPECAHRIAMLTNPLETQLVRSLGVQIGPGEASKCPFSGMVESAIGDGAPTTGSDTPIQWTTPARERLERIPEFVRPMALKGIERWARERGLDTVDEKVLEEARAAFGM